jgi:hypothetical protein
MTLFGEISIDQSICFIFIRGQGVQKKEKERYILRRRESLQLWIPSRKLNFSQVFFVYQIPRITSICGIKILLKRISVCKKRRVVLV